MSLMSSIPSDELRVLEKGRLSPSFTVPTGVTPGGFAMGQAQARRWPGFSSSEKKTTPSTTFLSWK